MLLMRRFPEIGDTAIAGGLGVAAALLHAPLIFRTVGGCDEWHILTAGARLAAGELMYRDVTHIAGPGSFYLSAALFSIFGVRFEVARITMLVLFAAVTAALYLITRRLTGRTPAALAALWFIVFRLWSFPHWQMLHYASLAMGTAVLAFAVLHAERPIGMGRAVAAGLLAGIAIITKQDSGALAALGCAAALGLGIFARRRDGGPRESWRPFFVFGASAAVPLLVVIAYFAAHGALWPLVLQTVYDTLVQHPLFVSGGGPEHVDYMPFPGLLPLFSQDQLIRGRLLAYMPALLWDLHWRTIGQSALFRDTNLLELAIKFAFRLPYAVLLVEVAATVRAWWRERDGTIIAARTAQLVFAAAALAALSKPRDWIHLSILLAPVAPLATRQLATIAAGGGLLRRLVRGSVAVVGLVYLAVSADLYGRALATYTAPISGPRGTAYARPGDAATLQGVVDALDATPPDRPVLAVPCVSAATFLAGRPCASRFPWLWPRDAHVDRDQQVIASLERHPDATVVYTLSHVPTISRLQAHAPTLFVYLAEHYQLGPVFGRDAIHLIVALAEKRRPSPPTTVAVHLTEHMADATAERLRDGHMEPVADVAEVAHVTTWALTPRVLSLSTGGGGETRLAFPVAVPARARLRLRAGLNPDFWQAIVPLPVRLRVSIEGAATSTQALAARHDVFTNPADRAWDDVDVDVSTLAGQTVRIVFAAAADGWGGEDGVAGFEDPRLEVGP
jgi:Dolichyl-phosphate-mannose-protein mannosyltransferase